MSGVAWPRSRHSRQREKQKRVVGEDKDGSEKQGRLGKQCLYGKQVIMYSFCRSEVWGCGEYGQWLKGRPAESQICRRWGPGGSLSTGPGSHTSLFSGVLLSLSSVVA